MFEELSPLVEHFFSLLTDLHCAERSFRRPTTTYPCSKATFDLPEEKRYGVPNGQWPHGTGHGEGLSVQAYLQRDLIMTLKAF